MTKLKTFKEVGIPYIENYLTSISYFKNLNFTITVHADNESAIKISAFYDGGMSATIINHVMEFKYDVQEENLQLYPPFCVTNGFIPNDFKQLIFAIVLEAFILYAKENSIKNIYLGINNKEINGALSIYRYWSKDFVDVLKANNIVFDAAYEEEINEYNKMVQSFKENPKHSVVYDFKHNVFCIDVKQFVYLIPNLIALEEAIENRQTKYPAEILDKELFKDGVPYTISIKNNYFDDTELLLKFNKKGIWKCISDGEISILKQPFEKGLDEIIKEVHEGNKLSYLLNPNITNLFHVFQQKFTNEELHEIAITLNTEGIDPFVLENESFLYVQEHQATEILETAVKTSIKVSRVAEKTFFLRIKDQYIFVSDEYNQGIEIHVSSSLEELQMIYQKRISTKLEKELV